MRNNGCSEQVPTMAPCIVVKVAPKAVGGESKRFVCRHRYTSKHIYKLVGWYTHKRVYGLERVSLSTSLAVLLWVLKIQKLRKALKTTYKRYVRNLMTLKSITVPITLLFLPKADLSLRLKIQYNKDDFKNLNFLEYLNICI